MIKQFCDVSVSTLTLNKISNLNHREKALFLLGCPILSLKDLLAKRVMQFMSLALRNIYKVRTTILDGGGGGHGRWMGWGNSKRGMKWDGGGGGSLRNRPPKHLVHFAEIC